MNVECDCGYLIKSETIKLKEHKQVDGLIDVYYQCPKCHKKHHICYHNAETKRLQKLIKKAYNSGDGNKEKEYKEKFKIALDALNNRL